MWDFCRCYICVYKAHESGATGVQWMLAGVLMTHKPETIDHTLLALYYSELSLYLDCDIAKG